MDASQSIDPFRPTLRIFLSVDLVGSTAFKQSNQSAFDEKRTASLEKPVEPWLSPIAQFYREIERIFAKRWSVYVESTADLVGWPKGDAPQLWKSAGDELLYTKVLNDHREALACVICWIETLREYRSVLKKRYPELDVKSAAWIAGFPVTNTEVIFRSSVAGEELLNEDDDPIYNNLRLIHKYYSNNKDEALTRDFIGPSIDTGFRVCGLATPRKFVLTIDLMLMIVHAIRTAPPDLDVKSIEFHYQGRESLKGVFGGFGYPVFWLDMAHASELERIEDRLLNLSARNTDDIKRFCEEFIAENPTRIIVPYIIGNQDKYFDHPPDHHNERLSRMHDYYKNETERRAIEQSSTAAKSGEGEEADGEDLLTLMRDLLESMRASTADPGSKPE